MASSVDTLTVSCVRNLLRDKYILILGDSVIRGLYKDMIKCSQSNDILNEDELRVKGENRFYGDQLIHGGIQKGLTNGLDYEEVREYTSGGQFRIRFYFLTRSYSAYIKNVVFHHLKNQTIKPDIIIMNSCLWDISRYGVESMRWYQENVDYVISSFSRMYPNAVFLWLSALPVSNSSKGGVMVPKAEYLRPILPGKINRKQRNFLQKNLGLIRDANYHCSQLCHRHNALFIDLHTTFSSMLHLRRPDGIHWNAIGVRLINEIIFNHLKAYYHGVDTFKCPILRHDLKKKIDQFKQRMKHSEKSYLNRNRSNEDSGINDMESSSPEDKHFIKSKRKRTDDDDDEKENNRKVLIKSSSSKTNKQPMAIRTKSSDSPDENQIESIDNRFDHQFCDMMYDNEYEGLRLFHFTNYDLEPSEEIDTEISSPVTIEKEQSSQFDYIVLSSSDEEDELNNDNMLSALSSTMILPVYLLNHL